MNNEQTALDITPQTRLAQLLQTYPQLEKVLLDLSPAFAKGPPLAAKLFFKNTSHYRVIRAWKYHQAISTRIYLSIMMT
ncbi:hypothetical protein JXO59_01435 [candidate division KSB1 bacterium]|nr:hypothetical protein [candidate division KSB1 bacterium]